MAFSINHNLSRVASRLWFIMLQFDVDLDLVSQQKIPKCDRSPRTTDKQERKSVGANSAPELAYIKFIGIQIHNELNGVTLESVIAHQVKCSRDNIFSKDWRSNPIMVAPTH